MAYLGLLSFIWMAIGLAIRQYIYYIKFKLTHCDRESFLISPIWKHY